MSRPGTDRRYLVEPLARSHDRTSFTCGVDALDRYLETQARQDVRRRVAATFVLREDESEKVLGFYTLSAAGIRLNRLPQAVAQRLPAYPVVPATLLGRLAVDRRQHGTGLGEHLLMDAFHRSWAASHDVASFAILVDAKDEGARAFYLRYDFIPFEADVGRLFLPMSTVARSFEQ